MALSKEEKEALNDHYKNRDLYDPSKAPEQEVTTFAPKAMADGGPVEAGYAEGGDVTSDFEGPVLSADTDTVKSPIVPPPPGMDAQPAAAPIAPAARVSAPPPIVSAPPAPMAAPVRAPSNLGPDEYSELLKTLSAKPTLGQTSMSALAGLADAIETGVARTASPGFQKNIAEGQQNQKRNLIDALKGKFESGQGARKLTEEERHNKSSESIGEHEASARLAEAKSGLQQNALEAMGRLSQSGGITGRIMGQPTQAQEAINALAERAGLSGGKSKIPTITTKAEYNALPKGTHYQDASGKQGIKK